MTINKTVIYDGVQSHKWSKSESGENMIFVRHKYWKISKKFTTVISKITIVISSSSKLLCYKYIFLMPQNSLYEMKTEVKKFQNFK